MAGSTLAFVPPGEAANESSTTPATAGAAGPSGYDPPIQPASQEAQRALSSFRVPEGMTASLIAAEPDLANPVAFSIDGQGRYWVCETFRQGNAVVDNRGREYWLLDDLAAQTVEDRTAYYRKHLGEEGFAAFGVHHDRIRLLTDIDADGKVDQSTVFADGFNSPVEGTGSGVVKVGDDLFYTNIPHLWRLRDANSDGVADEREKLLSGFGVRTAFRGHDMHGLVMGPDGRLYFSIGDRGFNVVTKEGERLAMPDRGAIFRCEPDGSNLEVFASGLRNPQELAFDDYGNLFTGDNNSDSGDQARWVYVAEGSDSGWRMYYQYLDDRGPWNREMMWFPYDTPPLRRSVATGAPTGVAAKDIQPAYILPPVTNIADGPSGLTHYPGVGLSDRYQGHFFLCDFRGTPNNSGVRSFAVKPKGAGFELVDSHEFIWSILCTDAEFAPDGRFVISDWVNGWNGEGKGRLYAFSDPEHVKAGEESVKLLAEDFSSRSPGQLIELFSHRDRRVRQKAHLELARRPYSEWPQNRVDVIVKSQEPIPALHLNWAAQIHARGGKEQALDVLRRLAAHPNPVVRSQAVRGLGDVMTTNAGAEALVKAISKEASNISRLTKSDELLVASLVKGSDTPRIAAERLITLARLSMLSGPHDKLRVKATADWTKTLNFLDKAWDDPTLRHSLIYAVSMAMSGDDLAKVKSHSSGRVRTGAVVALRRQQSARISEFLADAAPAVVTEAARAINDVPIEAATAQLAALASNSNLNDPTLRRVLNSNFRLGGKQNAEAVAKVAADPTIHPSLRVEALAELSLWADPPKLDRVTGMYRPLATRDASFVAAVVRPILAKLLEDGEAGVRVGAIDLASTHRIAEAASVLRSIAGDAEVGEEERVAALRALGSLDVKDLGDILARAVEAESPRVRSEARDLWSAHDPAAAVPNLDRTIAEGEIVEKQAAIATLARLGIEPADAVLTRWFDKFVSGQVPAEIGLDLLEAAEKQESLKGRLEAYRSGISAGDPLAEWRVSLAGGNAEKGRDIFLNRASVSCLRCHKVEDDRGGEVGPNLAKIGSTKDRSYLLEAIVKPNAKIAEGFESVVVVTSEGLVITGVKRAEDEKSLTIITAEGKGIVVPKDEIEDRAVGQSAMPEDLLKHLTNRDVRDLVEYLAAQRGQGRWEEGTEE